jgi:hypothetical protein
MKKTISVTLLFLFSFSASSAIFKGHDNELNCERYMSQESQYLDKKEAELARDKKSQVLKRVSIKAALNFSKSDNEFHLKGSFGYWPIVTNVTFGEFETEYLMSNIFNSVCLSGQEVVDVEFKRKALNNWNDVDALKD